MKTAEEWAEQVEIVVDEVGSAHDPSRYVNYEATQTKIAAVIAEAVAAEKERVLSTDQARFHTNASLPGTWEYETLEGAKEDAAELERQRVISLAQALVEPYREQIAAGMWPEGSQPLTKRRACIALMEQLIEQARAKPIAENTTSECNMNGI